MIDLRSLQCIVFDFDGVLTDNMVFVDQHGNESVRCSRSDGLAFDELRRTSLQLYILSTESNPVVSARGAKIRIPVHQGIGNKRDALVSLAMEQNFKLSQTMYVGNDLNDYHAMQTCGFRLCPQDSHPRIKALADIVLEVCGGHGVVREIVEDVLGLDMLMLLNPHSNDPDGCA
jgi:YrbI family 3-deoxy-D-manno-octulosonate 8-phosphate phosphatase